MQQSLYGLRGIITDSISGLPLKAKVEIIGHDIDSSHVFSSLPIGNYHRYIYQGSYQFTFSKTGYYSKTINASIINNNFTLQDVQLVPIGFVGLNDIQKNKKLIKSIDILGRENNNSNLKINIFKDGTINKKLIIDQK